MAVDGAVCVKNMGIFTTGSFGGGNAELQSSIL